MPFRGKALVIGHGGVSRCAFLLLLKHLRLDLAKVTVIDSAGKRTLDHANASTAPRKDRTIALLSQR